MAMTIKNMKKPTINMPEVSEDTSSRVDSLFLIKLKRR